MRKTIFLVGVMLVSLHAEDAFNFTPALTVETEINQEIGNNADYGNISLAKMEAGFELSKGDLSAVVNLETHVSNDYNSIELNEAFATYTIFDGLSVTAGRFANAFGFLKTEALSDPLIKSLVETKVPTFQADFNKGIILSSFAMYNGLMTNNYKAIVPAIGVKLKKLLLAKLSSRIEFAEDSVFFDMSLGGKVTPIKLISADAEVYTELTTKNNTKKFGYYVEAIVNPLEKLSVAVKYDQLINDITSDSKIGDQMLMDITTAYEIIEHLSARLSYQMSGTREITDAIGNKSEYDWTHSILLNVCFEY